RVGSVTSWAAYPAGVAWALREAGHAVGGASLAIDSKLPQGAGLSSSAAIESAAAVAPVTLYQGAGPRPGPARPARRAANERAGGERDGRRAQRHHGPVRVPAQRGGPRPAAGLPHRG